MQCLLRQIFAFAAASALVASLPFAAYAAGPNLQSAYNRIGTELASSKAADSSKAVAAINDLISKDAYQCRLMLRNRWLPVLMARKRYQVVADMAQLEILNNPDSTNNVNILQSLRVQALLAAGKDNRALAAAKSLFNVATMQNTANAIMLVAQCLAATSANGPQQVALFRQQQEAGAKLPAGNGKPVTCAVLANIEVHATAYLAAARKQPNQRIEDLVGKGNLMLLADKPKQARIDFDQAYSMAWNNQWLAAVSERIAASIKAQDGTVGRANAWVLSIRPDAMTNNH
jgi:hypothetical protein